MFERQFYKGRVGESAIAKYLNKKGYSILPVYELEIHRGKGPRFHSVLGDLIAPDMLAMHRSGKRTLWIEAKHKEAFTWHRITQEWVTGIDLKHYLDYLKIDSMNLFPVWLLFLQRGGQAKDSPPDSPCGLYGERISVLKTKEHHRFLEYGAGGMVYWAEATLKKLAELSELETWLKQENRILVTTR
jgi:hypothetical protein